ncbi:class I tRNA ligase family protein, partial [Brevundimonas sp.]
NSAIAKLYAFVAVIRDAAQAGGEARRQALSALARLIAPFTPHLAEEGWTRLGEDGMVLDAPWPVWDAALAADDDVVLPIQINGKRRAEIRVARGSEPAEVEALVLADDTVKARLEGLSVKKIVVVKDRIVNLVAG